MSLLIFKVLQIYFFDKKINIYRHLLSTLILKPKSLLSISKQKSNFCGKKIRNCRFTIGCLIWWISKWSQSINLPYLINGIKCILVWRQKNINTDLKGILIDNSLKLEMLEKRLALLRRASFFRVVHVEEFQAQIC